MIVVVMGVTGSGKSTVGAMLADAMGSAFLDGDWLHSEANRGKLQRGIPLTDADRAPWLAAIHARIAEAFENGRGLVVACSALKQAYRTALSGSIPVKWVYLKGPEALLDARVRQRKGHFVGPELLASQLQTLEEPSDAIVADISRPPAAIVAMVLDRLG